MSDHYYNQNNKFAMQKQKFVVFQKNPLAEGPSTSTSAVADSEEAFPDVDDDNDELDLDELNELEASLSRTSIRIQEPVRFTS
ncbi:hypothetical protein LOK49_LG08G01396 [Camellia lanceoleosa]|uniref:Uncharacterized protein n=1 Tax=Camellia lanceoleosa TaxID=1840588 RepID=A0ACC0GUY0_9ERIC|nr:hypothetical protein LOK49_LG08G01396 [Camellia lanceoleosa]